MIDYCAATDVPDPNNTKTTLHSRPHSQTDNFQEFEKALPDLLAGEPEVLRFEVESATELEL